LEQSVWDTAANTAIFSDSKPTFMPVSRRDQRKAFTASAARQELSPEQKEELDKQTSDAAGEGDTANVLQFVEDGADIEWHNPREVSEWASR